MVNNGYDHLANTYNVLGILYIYLKSHDKVPILQMENLG